MLRYFKIGRCELTLVSNRAAMMCRTIPAVECEMGVVAKYQRRSLSSMPKVFSLFPSNTGHVLTHSAVGHKLRLVWDTPRYHFAAHSLGKLHRVNVTLEHKGHYRYSSSGKWEFKCFYFSTVTLNLVECAENKSKRINMLMLIWERFVSIPIDLNGSVFLKRTSQNVLLF